MNIVPEDDVGFVADSGQSEPGLRHDLDEAISSEGAAGSDLHAGRMKSLRHLFMMDVQQPATRGRTTPSPTDARQRSERALFIVVLAVRSTHRLIAAPVAESLWGARTGARAPDLGFYPRHSCSFASSICSRSDCSAGWRSSRATSRRILVLPDDVAVLRRQIASEAGLG